MHEFCAPPRVCSPTRAPVFQQSVRAHVHYDVWREPALRQCKGRQAPLPACGHSHSLDHACIQTLPSLAACQFERRALEARNEALPHLMPRRGVGCGVDGARQGAGAAGPAAPRRERGEREASFRLMLPRRPSAAAKQANYWDLAAVSSLVFQACAHLGFFAGQRRNKFTRPAGASEGLRRQPGCNVAGKSPRIVRDSRRDPTRTEAVSGPPCEQAAR